MNETHIHLLINHLPIVGSILGGLVLGYAIWTKNVQTSIAAYNVLILSSVGAIIAYTTGEGAEEAIENIQGISKNALDEHEDFAIVSLYGLIATGFSALVGLFTAWKKSPLARVMTIVTLCISLIAFGLVGRTGYLGGQIRHTELSNGQTIQSPSEAEED